MAPKWLGEDITYSNHIPLLCQPILCSLFFPIVFSLSTAFRVSCILHVHQCLKTSWDWFRLLPYGMWPILGGVASLARLLLTMSGEWTLLSKFCGRGKTVSARKLSETTFIFTFGWDGSGFIGCNIVGPWTHPVKKHEETLKPGPMCPNMDNDLH